MVYMYAPRVQSEYMDPLKASKSTAILIMRRVVLIARTDSLGKQVPGDRISLVAVRLDVKVGSIVTSQRHSGVLDSCEPDTYYSEH